MYKVSGTGWLCKQVNIGWKTPPDTTWVPMFKLTPEQIREWNVFHQHPKRGEDNVSQDRNEA